MKSFFCFFQIPFLLLLAACQSPDIPWLTTKTGGVLFEDEFSNPPGEWPEYSTGNASTAFSDGEYILSIASPSFTAWALSDQVFENVRVEVDASLLGGPISNLYGLACRASPEGNFYFFIISSDGYYAIGMASEGETTLLGQEMMAYNATILHGEETNHLRFDCIDSTLSGYVNGQMVAITGDGSFTSGDTGVIAGSFEQGGVVVSFDNFVILKP